MNPVLTHVKPVLKEKKMIIIIAKYVLLDIII